MSGSFPITDSPTWIEETLDVVRGLLSDPWEKARRDFPNHLTGEITAALNDPALRADMLAQLIRLCFARKDGIDVGGIRFLDGRMLYNTDAAVIWGAQQFDSETEFAIMDRSLRIIGNRPCWIERNTASQKERVVWAGRRGILYPIDSITSLRNCGGVPCYGVNYSDENTNGLVGFVVLDETEGRQYESIDYLMTANNEPAYIAYDKTRRQHAFVIGTDEVFADYNANRLCVAQGVAYAVQTKAGDYSVVVWRGRIKLFDAHRVEGLFVVDDQIAFAARMTQDGPITTCIRGETREFASVHCWRRLQSGDNQFVVFDGWEPEVGVHVNYVRLCDGCIHPNSIARVEEDGVTLRVPLVGETKARSFNLRELGII